MSAVWLWLKAHFAQFQSFGSKLFLHASEQKPSLTVTIGDGNSGVTNIFNGPVTIQLAPAHQIAAPQAPRQIPEK
jgi:hypothetical protein